MPDMNNHQRKTISDKKAADRFSNRQRLEIDNNGRRKTYEFKPHA